MSCNGLLFIVTRALVANNRFGSRRSRISRATSTEQGTAAHRTPVRMRVHASWYTYGHLLTNKSYCSIYRFSEQTTPAVQNRMQPLRDVNVPSTQRPVRLFIAEQQQLLREAYQTVLAGAAGIEVVGSTSDVQTSVLVTTVATLAPDVTILGTDLLTPHHVELLRTLQRRTPQMGLVAVAVAFDPLSVRALQEFPRRRGSGLGYLLQRNAGTVEGLVRIITSVAGGERIADPAVLEAMTVGAGAGGALDRLSPREQEVLGWLARAYRNNDIARILGLKPKTVERHVNNIYEKLSDGPNGRHPRVRAAAMFLAADWAASWSAPGSPDARSHYRSH